MIHIIFLLLLSCTVNEAMGRHYPLLPSAPSTALPIDSNAANLVNLKPWMYRRVFHRSEVKNCMPKGFHHSSAPSRDRNYQTLGSFRCFSGSHPTKP
ncbi:hypothetical protein CDL12_14991 [Handroanthus impetiginosus]|uniref:Secreted protein n=1 Tax=Handroanthus impetiginosus TaxID=429701 RepID=A0A2G9H4F6_9LAMI|nr:hypothetical protein CDL12_14991 [Handroanthus impetiginosus]